MAPVVARLDPDSSDILIAGKERETLDWDTLNKLVNMNADANSQQKTAWLTSMLVISARARRGPRGELTARRPMALGAIATSYVGRIR